MKTNSRFCRNVFAISDRIWCNKHLRHSTTEKYGNNGKDGYFRFDDDNNMSYTVYPKKYAHGFVVLCFVVVTQSFIMNSHEVFIHIHQGCFAGTGAIVRLPQCQWSKPVGYGKISQGITTTKHSKAKTVCIFLGIYCRYSLSITYTEMGQLNTRNPIYCNENKR